MISYILLMLLPFFNVNSNIECELHGVTYEFSDCDTEGNYTIFFNFQYQNTSDSFRAYKNNDYVGTYAYTDLPIEIGTFEGNGAGHVFFFKDNEDLECSVTKQTEGLTCGEPGECDLSELQLIELPCNPNNQFNVKINFNHQNTSGQFKVQGNGNQYGTFNYADLPITIGLFNGLVNTDYEFVIKDIEDPECSIAGVIHAPYCNTGECNISNITYDLTDCNEEGNYWIKFNFDYQNTSDSFKVYSANNYHGTYAYEDLPITIYGIAGNGQGNGFLFKDQSNTSCAEDIFVPGQECNGQACDLSELQIEQLPCNENNQFNVVIDFNYVNTSDQFKIFGNGNTYGPFSYDDLPVTLGPFNGLVNNGYEFLIKDIQNADCNISGFIDGPYCNEGACDLYEVAYNLGPCNEEGNYSIFLSFQYENTSDSFKLYIENTYYGTYAYSDMPVQIDGLEGNGQEVHYKFIDLLNGDCHVVKEITGPDCGNPGECELGNLSIYQFECNEEGQFNVKINFDYANTSGLFKVQGNGNNYGTYNYNELPIILGPFNGNVNTPYEFGITDLELSNCHIGGGIEAPYCSEGDCHIFEVVYEFNECDNEGNYNIWFNFQYENTSDSFKVFRGDDYLGTFAYTSLPITLGSFPGNGQGHVFYFIDNETSGCKAIKQLPGQNCDGNECDLNELQIEQLPCNEENQFFVVINFNHVNTSDQFKVFGNGNQYGTFGYDDLPITLGPFNGLVNTAYEFLIKDVQNADCNISGFIDGPYCSEVCHLYDVVYDLGECNEEGNYSIFLNLQYQNTSDSFKLYVENTYYGTFAYADLPIQINGLEGNGQELHYKFIDLVNGDCHAVKEITGPDCDGQGDCDLSELSIFQFECNEEGQFNVKINFNYTNTSGQFKVQGNGNNYGTFSYGDLPIILGPFDGNVNTSYEFGITDLEFQDCHIGGGIEAPYCEESCHLFDVVYDYSDCNEDGFYNITFNFQHQNTSDSFKVYKGNDYLGVFAYADLPVTLGNFAGNGQGHLFIFKDVVNPACKVIKEVPGLNCEGEGECDINEVSALISNCDENGQFFVEIDFNFNNVSDSFKIQGNGINYGHFSYDDLPILLGPFNGDSEDSYEFGVKDLVFEGCNAGTFISPPYCENGFNRPVMNIILSNITCVDENNYTADVDVDNIAGEMLVNLWEANTLIGIYNSASFPVNVMLSTELASMIKLNSVDEPANYAAKAYTHPDCLLATDNNDEQNIQVFPNPTSSDLIINWKDVSYDYQLSDINNTLVLKGKGSDRTLVQTANLQPGVYIIHLNTDNKIIVKKVIKI